MTDAQKVVERYRRRAEDFGDCTGFAAELNAIADVVEAGERMADDASAEREWAREHGGDPSYEQAFQDSHKSGGFDELLATYRTALGKLAKAVGVEGEK